MSNKTDSNSYTIIFAIVMVIVVGSLLAFTASSLKPNIKENERMEKQQNILYAMGVNENEEGSITFISTEKYFHYRKMPKLKPILGSFFNAGFLPNAPGTWGSFFALFPIYFMGIYSPWYGMVFLTVLFSFITVWVS